MLVIVPTSPCMLVSVLLPPYTRLWQYVVFSIYPLEDMLKINIQYLLTFVGKKTKKKHTQTQEQSLFENVIVKFCKQTKQTSILSQSVLNFPPY